MSGIEKVVEWGKGLDQKVIAGERKLAENLKELKGKAENNGGDADLGGVDSYVSGSGATQTGAQANNLTVAEDGFWASMGWGLPSERKEAPSAKSKGKGIKEKLTEIKDELKSWFGINKPEPKPAPKSVPELPAAPTPAPTANVSPPPTHVDPAPKKKAGGPSTVITVKKGQTLDSIVMHHYNIKDPARAHRIALIIAKQNGIKNPNKIKPGQKIKMPSINAQGHGPAHSSHTGRHKHEQVLTRKK
jgi:hypothetical protein